MPGPESTPVKNLIESGVFKGNHLTVELEEGVKPIRISGIVQVTNLEGVRAYYHIDTHASRRPDDGQDRPVPGRSTAWIDARGYIWSKTGGRRSGVLLSLGRPGEQTIEPHQETNG